MIPANGFYLLESTNDQSVPGVGADFIYTGALSNSNEGLRLFAFDCDLIEEVLASPNWPAGDSSSKRAMQREGNLSWSTYGGGAVNGVFGTPRAKNGPALAQEDVASKIVSKTNGTPTGSSGGSGSSSQSSPTLLPANVLITEVQITGGPGKPDYDFIEIFNPTSQSVNLNGHRLVKRAATSTSDTSIKSWTSDTIVPANGYYLWANSGYAEISATPDVTTLATISKDNGIAIRFGAEDTGTIIDSVGWGKAANAFVEGSVFATNPGANESVHRKTGSGYLDSGNNASDFQLTTCPSPRAATTSCGPANQAPVAVLSFSPASPTTADTVSFTGASSSDPDDPDGSISYYSWNFGDSTSASSSSATTTHTYTTAGSYTASVTVLDNQNALSIASTTITVTSPAPALAVLFEQPNATSTFLWSGTLSTKGLLNPASGSARQLHLKVKPNAVASGTLSHIGLVGIYKNSDFTNFSIPPDGIATSYTDQSYYCFSPAQSNTWVDVILTFPINYSGIFTSGDTFVPFLVALSNSPNYDPNYRISSPCVGNSSAGQGNHNQIEIKTDGSGNLYFQIGN